jgi:protein-S-isoprenylcysteine O-methyltransferase Ste14/NAD-dependent dihydropyrimidine dehydrogenase PreA subunit
LPIDPAFKKNRNKSGDEKGVTIWGPVDPPGILGIRGTSVAVDWDICTGCGVCLEVCPVKLYEWMDTPGHPISEKKAFPARESDCVECLECETRCPLQAIRVTFVGFRTGWDKIIVLFMFLQIIAGIIYGVLYGPYLEFKILFYVGWFVLLIGFVFFILGPYELGKRGVIESDRFTTVLVDSGIFAIVRHPMILGCMMFVSASMLISQHWLSLVLGILIIALLYVDMPNDDKRLILKFGDDYKRYMQRVPRLNPLLGVIKFLVKKQRK